ncbi:hypothetical protein QQS21_011518 [Conoideocrella luteorostrata]|uniref:ABC transporter n=1 Tax=Conoideocrella luteorostrata TaxID=1105319 RepID=A0AAJ0CFQ0_9HYPO|nr:hypothetical protein QQS21_011518 [Conoideocrella luteorostrata]
MVARTLMVSVLLNGAQLFVESSQKDGLLFEIRSRLAPEETAGILQRILFLWVNPILKRGASGLLQDEDFQVADSRLATSKLRKDITELWSARVQPETKTTLPLVLLKCLGPSYAWAMPSRLLLIVLRYGQPLLIKQTIHYLNNAPASRFLSPGSAWIIAVAVVVYVGEAICGTIYLQQQNRLKVMTRGALVGLIYSKTLQSRSHLHDRGRAITLMNTDVDSLCGIGRMGHDVWAYLVELCVGMVILASQVGWLFPLPIVIIVFCSRVSKYVATHMHGKQKSWNVATQDRLSLINGFLGSMKTIKLLGVSQGIAKHISCLRNIEIECAKGVRWIMIAYNASANALGIFVPAVTMILYAILARSRNSRLDPETAFTTVAILSTVIHPANMIMTIFPRIIATIASCERIQCYLLEAPHIDQRTTQDSSKITTVPNHPNAAISLRGVTIQADARSEVALNNVSLDIKHSQIAVCAGPTGAGKSLLARVLLGEGNSRQGMIMVRSRKVGYCDQSPWLPNGSIQNVICNFATRLDKSRYEEAVFTSCLVHDMEQLPLGDKTEIGSRGLNLSGGQRQRIAIARMLYAKCDIVVLDDPFSSLDGRTEDQMVKNLFGLDGVFRQRKTTVFWISSATHYFKLSDVVIIVEKSRIKEHCHWSKLKSTPEASRKILSDDKPTSLLPNSRIQHMEMRQKRAEEKDITTYLNRDTGNFSLYGFYFRSSGTFNALFMISCTATYSFFITFPHYWLKRWTDADQSAEWHYMLVYGVLALCAWTATNGTMWSTYMLVTPRSGFSLHAGLLRCIVEAPLAFFSTTDLGVTLNRFTQDIQFVDRDLPGAFQAFSNQIFKLLVQITLLLSVQKLLILTLPVGAVVVWFVARFYFQTSRQVRARELAARSRVLSHIVETVEGLTTIRAFGWQEFYQSTLDDALDFSQNPMYLLACLQRWLNLILDLLVAAISLTVISLALFLRGSMSGAAVGVALNVIVVANATIVRLVESWADFEVSLGAIERLKAFEEDIESEGQPWENNVPEEPWPRRGKLVMKNVTASYTGKSTILLSLLRLVDTTGNIRVDGIDLSRVPRDVIRQRCFITVPQEPLLLPDLSLRFCLDPSDEAAEADIVEALRKTGVWEVVRGSSTDIKFTLDRKISELPVLSAGQLQLFGLSRALVRKSIMGNDCRPILLLDEATSSLDTATESLIHEMIDKEFSAQGYTVLAIAHRLSVIGKQTETLDTVVTMADGFVQKICCPDNA